MIGPRTTRLLLGLAAACLTGRADVGFEGREVRCGRATAWLAPPDSRGERQYAPDREIDLLHLELGITPDFAQRTIAGQATLRFKPLAKPLAELRLDAVGLNVRQVTCAESLLEHQSTDRQIVITFAAPLPPDREVAVTIDYTAQPTRGLYFRTPEMGYPEGEAHLFTQGEAIEARHWYPCIDAPNERFTSEILCRVPAGMVVLSNGRRVAESPEAGTGRVAVRWLQDKPHVNYLISLVAGHFRTIADRYRDVPLAFHTPPSQIDQAIHSFRDTAEMMAFFEQEIGVPYPWAKYDQVCVHDFVAGGMENTSITTLTDGTLHTAATETLRSSEGLVAHELAHQWFGDLVTCKDWSQLWLNEGFATYYETLYRGHKHGRDDLLYEMYERAREITGRPRDTRPIVRRTFDQPGEMFDYLTYPKGSWVLHMLRAQLGEPLYRRAIRTYLERHQLDSVVTEDLNAVLEELSGRSLDQFFDQWVYHAHHPELEVGYQWDERRKLAKITLRQVQTVDQHVLLFRCPLIVRFKTASATVDCPLLLQQPAEDFYFALPEAPRIVRLDPELTLLARVHFPLPDPLLLAQLADPEDVVGRLIAVERLAERKDHTAIAQLQERLAQDKFYGVRVEAARGLAKIHTPEALEALLAAPPQPEARVRQAVVASLGRFYDARACAAARATLETESNPAIVIEAIEALGAYHQPEIAARLRRYLETPSYRNELAEAALGAIRLQDDPAYLDPVLDCLGRREREFTTFGLARGLETAAYLARNQTNKDTVRDFLLARVNHPQQRIRLAALRALGTLGDPQAIAVVERFAAGAKDSPERGAAEPSLRALRAGRKPVDDLKNLRDELLALQQANRELRRELDDLKKRLEALPPPAAEVKARKKPAAGKAR